MIEIVKHLKNLFNFYFKNNTFKIRGQKNTIKYNYRNSRFQNLDIVVRGNNNIIQFGNHCDIRGLSILIKGNNNVITIGDKVTINASATKPAVINCFNGTSISIGKESLLAKNIEIHSTDYHSIYNQLGERVNDDQSVLIGDRTWISLDVKILKGTIIPNGTIIGANSLVTGKFHEEHTIIAGIPAKVIKHNMYWEK